MYAKFETEFRKNVVKIKIILLLTHNVKNKYKKFKFKFKKSKIINVRISPLRSVIFAQIQ